MSTITREFYQGSTGNVSPEARDWLNAQAKENFQSRNASAYVMCGPYGWWIYAEPVPHDDWPKELTAIMAKAAEAKCNWIDLDCDNDPIEGLPFYDW